MYRTSNDSQAVRYLAAVRRFEGDCSGFVAYLKGLKRKMPCGSTDEHMVTLLRYIVPLHFDQIVDSLVEECTMEWAEDNTPADDECSTMFQTPVKRVLLPIRVSHTAFPYARLEARVIQVVTDSLKIVDCERRLRRLQQGDKSFVEHCSLFNIALDLVKAKKIMYDENDYIDVFLRSLNEAVKVRFQHQPGSLSEAIGIARAASKMIDLLGTKQETLNVIGHWDDGSSVNHFYGERKSPYAVDQSRDAQTDHHRNEISLRSDNRGRAIHGSPRPGHSFIHPERLSQVAQFQDDYDQVDQPRQERSEPPYSNIQTHFLGEHPGNLNFASSRMEQKDVYTHIPRRYTRQKGIFQPEDRLQEGPQSDLGVKTFVACLNSSTTPRNYIENVFSAVGLEASHKESLNATMENILPLNDTLRTLVSNASNMEEVRSVLPQYLGKRKPHGAGNNSTPISSLPDDYAVHPKKNRKLENLNSTLEKDNSRLSMELSSERDRIAELQRALETRAKRNAIEDVEREGRELQRERSHMAELQRSRDREFMQGKDSSNPRNRPYNPSVPQDRGDNNASRGKKGCQKCNVQGHGWTKCPELIDRNGEKIPFCYFCRKTGHYCSDCPELAAMVCGDCNKKGHRTGYCRPKDCRKCSGFHGPLDNCPGYLNDRRDASAPRP